MSRTLEGKSAVVTGAGRGIGREIAKAFAAEGADVVVNDLGCGPQGESTREDPAGDVVAEIRLSGGSAVANGGSVSDAADVQSLMEMAVQQFGHLDILVNAAGIVNNSPLAELKDEDWKAVMGVHVGGHLACSTAAIPHMRRRGYGRIINFTSGVGLIRDIQFTAYGVAKRAVAALTFHLAGELAGSPITCNAISPLALTRLSGAPTDGRDVPPMLRNLPTADLIAPLALYLASPASSSITGRILFTNGFELSRIVPPQPVEMVTLGASPNPADLDLAIERILGPAAVAGSSTGGSAARLQAAPK